MRDARRLTGRLGPDPEEHLGRGEKESVLALHKEFVLHGSCQSDYQRIIWICSVRIVAEISYSQCSCFHLELFSTRQ